MRARLLYLAKVVFPDGAIQEAVIWKLPSSSAERPHGLKYSLYYGRADGTSLIRYDNERGKGDHRHVGGTEQPYRFVDVDTLLADFLADIRREGRRSDG